MDLLSAAQLREGIVATAPPARRSGRDALLNGQASGADQCGDVVGMAQAEVLREIGQDQPRFPVRSQVLADAPQEAIQDPPRRVEDASVEVGVRRSLI